MNASVKSKPPQVSPINFWYIIFHVLWTMRRGVCIVLNMLFIAFFSIYSKTLHRNKTTESKDV